MSDSIWVGWELRIEDYLRKKGFRDLGEYLQSAPGIPYAEIAMEMGINIAPIHLIMIQFDEAKKKGAIRTAATDALARDIAEACPDGWQMPESTAQRLMPSTWAVHVTGFGGRCPEFEPQVDAIMNAISPPIGWKPISGDDPYIASLFAEHWPSETKGEGDGQNSIYYALSNWPISREMLAGYLAAGLDPNRKRGPAKMDAWECLRNNQELSETDRVELMNYLRSKVQQNN